ncbi:MAG: phage tail sheath family protein [Deltaproteobacteria bacterium]|nr:phage tail sheath family protein [Deltaproteobacteria bacterium]
MGTLTVPGVYIKEVEPKKTLPFQTNIAGFVGMSQRGPLNSPQPITSWEQFRVIFGEVVAYSYISDAVFGFFENGGTFCYVVRVAKIHKKNDESIEIAKRALTTISQGTIRVNAINEGEWGNEITGTLESESSENFILTKVVDPIEVNIHELLGSPPTTIDKHFESVAGLGNNDELMLTHPTNPSIRAKIIVDEIDYNTNKVSIQFLDLSGINLSLISETLHLPEGTLVLGKGIKVTFNYKSRTETYDNLSLNPEHERYFERIINGEPVLDHYVDKLTHDHSLLVEIKIKKKDQVPARPLNIEEFWLGIGMEAEEGSDGEQILSYRDFAGVENLDFSFNQDAREKLFGLATFVIVEDISIVAIPDLVLAEDEQGVQGEGTRLGQRAMLNHCAKMGNRFAILDPLISQTIDQIKGWPDNFNLLPDSKNGALYYPWLKAQPISETLDVLEISASTRNGEGGLRVIPPSGHIAGIYSHSDSTRGVHKAPANEIIKGIVDLEKIVTDTDQAVLNPVGVNCIRSFAGRGIRIWGARTLSHEPMWHYVNIRRVCLTIKGYIIQNLLWAVFEPNNSGLWARIETSLTSFFESLVLDGVLSGLSPEDLFSVQCDEETNPPEVIEAGQVIAQVSFLAMAPAEYIILTIKRTNQTVTVEETPA